MQSLISQVGEGIKKFNDSLPGCGNTHQPGNQDIFVQTVGTVLSNVYVLSFQEIANNVQIQSIGNIAL